MDTDGGGDPAAKRGTGKNGPRNTRTTRRGGGEEDGDPAAKRGTGKNGPRNTRTTRRGGGEEDKERGGELTTRGTKGTKGGVEREGGERRRRGRWGGTPTEHTEHAERERRQRECGGGRCGRGGRRGRERRTLNAQRPRRAGEERPTPAGEWERLTGPTGPSVRQGRSKIASALAWPPWRGVRSQPGVAREHDPRRNAIPRTTHPERVPEPGFQAALSVRWPGWPVPAMAAIVPTNRRGRRQCCRAARKTRTAVRPHGRITGHVSHACLAASAGLAAVAF